MRTLTLTRFPTTPPARLRRWLPLALAALVAAGEEVTVRLRFRAIDGRSSWNVALVDLFLGDESGAELCQELREISSNFSKARR